MTPPHAPSETGREPEFLRLGDDPFGRDEPTVFYRHPEAGECYVWLKLLRADDPLRLAALLPHPPQQEPEP